MRAYEGEHVGVLHIAKAARTGNPDTSYRRAYGIMKGERPGYAFACQVREAQAGTLRTQVLQRNVTYGPACHEGSVGSIRLHIWTIRRDA